MKRESALFSFIFTFAIVLAIAPVASYAQAFVFRGSDTSVIPTPASSHQEVVQPVVDQPIAPTPTPEAAVETTSAIGATSLTVSALTPGGTRFVATSNYNIRNANGDRLCSVPRGTPLVPSRLNAEGDYIQVRVNYGDCPTEGWISINGLRPVSGTGDSMRVDTDGLSLRSSPGTNENYLCSLPKNTPVGVIEQRPQTDRYRAWVRIHIANPPGNCPSEGWVHSEYLRADDSLLANLPRDTVSVDEADTVTEATIVIDCAACVARNIQDLQEVVAGVRSMGNLDTWTKNRGLVQIPTRGSNGNVGPCGSFHYNPDRSNSGNLVDNYAAPITACVMMSLLQDWKQRHPDSSRGSRIQWGDISHRTRSKFNGHQTHTEGECIDFRPMREGAFQNLPLYRTDAAYDRELTREFIELAQSKGASVVYFNDRQINCSRANGHDNHVHVCFPSNAQTREVCRNYRYDPNICGDDQ